MSVTLLLGTTKGSFLLRPDGEGWAVSGPYCGGWPINHMAGDPESGVIWAAGGGEFHGAGVWRSGDGGESWALSRFANGQMNEFLKAEPEMAKAFGMEPEPPAPSDGEVVALWSIRRAGGRLYAGAKPAALFESRDGGESWAKVEGLTAHPSAQEWEPGAAGLVELDVTGAGPGRDKAPPPLLTQTVLVTDGPTAFAPGLVGAAETAGLSGFELRHRGRVIGTLSFDST